MNDTDPTPSDGRHLIEGLTTVVLLLDSSLRLEFINPAGEALLESSSNRIVGRPIGELVAGDDDFHAGLARALRSGHPFSERERGLEVRGHRGNSEVFVERPGGVGAPSVRTAGLFHEITVDLTVTPLTEGGERWLLIEMVQIDRQLRIAREEQLLSQQAATHALLRGLAHEVKNPLGGLRGAAQLLERELPSPSLREYTRIIIGEADRLRDLVDRMLGPHRPPRRESINIHEVLEHVRGLVGAEAPPGVTITTDYDPSIPGMEADRDLLIQAILNVVRNALQAVGDEGSIIIVSRILRQYTIGRIRYRLVAVVRVVDDGPGIPPEMAGRLFCPMVSGRADGTGLGLAIAQSLINLHGGLIECESRPGRTVFTLLIPLEGMRDG